MPPKGHLMRRRSGLAVEGLRRRLPMKGSLIAGVSLGVGLAAMAATLPFAPTGLRSAQAQTTTAPDSKGAKRPATLVPVETTAARAAMATSDIRAVGSLQ